MNFRKYLYSLCFFSLSITVQSQKAIELKTPITKGDNLSSCSGYKLLDGFSFKADSKNSLTLSVDKLLCTPWENSITDSDNNGFPDHFTIDKQREVGEIPIISNVSPIGSITYSVPIDLYPGRNNLQPNVSLAYNSIGGNGVAGMGWNLGGLSSISITNASVYYDDNVKAASRDGSTYALDGVRLISLGDGKYQSEQGNIKVKSHIASDLCYFEVFYPNGNKAIYGYKNNKVTEISYPLTRMEDQLGNYIDYEYDKASSLYYLKKISYGATPTNSAHFAFVSFVYEDRNDITLGYSNGLEVKQDKRLKKIQSYYNSTLLKTYALGYEEKAVSFLRQIDMAVDGKTVNPLVFYYGEEKDLAFDVSEKKLNGYTAPTHFEKGNTIFTDLNILTAQLEPLGPRNGLLVYPKKSSYMLSSVAPVITSGYLNDTLYIYKDITKDEAPLKVNITGTNYKGGTKFDLGQFRELFLVDINGDGKETLIKMASNISYGAKFENLGFTYYNDKMEDSGGFDIRLGGVTHTTQKSGKYWSALSKSFLVGDFLGNGRNNLLYFEHSQNLLEQDRVFSLTSSVANPDSWDVDKYPEFNTYEHSNNTGNSFAGYVDLASKKRLYDKSCFKVDPGDIMFTIDFDGDGKHEVCHITKKLATIYSFSLETGFSKIGSTDLSTFSFNKDYNTVIVGDINADGKTDFMLSPMIEIMGRRFAHDGKCIGCCEDYSIDTPGLTYPFEAACDIHKYPEKICTITGIEDYVASGGGDKWKIFYSDGKSSFIKKETSIIRYNKSEDFYLQDVDSDGFPELVRVDTGGNILVYNNKNGVLSSSSIVTTKVKPNARIAVTNIEEAHKMNKLIVIEKNILTSMSFNANRHIERMLKNVVTSSGIIYENTYSNLGYLTSYSLTGTQLAFPYAKMYTNVGIIRNINSFYNNQKLESNTYKYTNGIIHKQGLGFRGYEKIEITDNIREILTTQVYDPYKFGVLKESDSPTTKVKNEYTVKVDNNKIAKVTLDKKEATDKLKGVTITATYGYDTYGNLTNDTIKYAEGLTTINASTPKNINTDSYYILGLPEEQIQTNTRDRSSVTTKTKIVYKDNYLPESKTTFYNENPVSEEKYGYDAAWNLTSTQTKAYKSINWIKTSATYDAYGRVQTETDPLGMTTEYSYNAKGLLATSKNHKNKSASITYDRWGNVIKTTHPDGVVETVSVKWADSPTGALIVSTTTATGQPQSVVYLDALGRELRTGQKRFDGKYLYTDTEYDAKGRVKRTSLPFKGTAASLWNTPSYDAYDRITSLTYASGKIDEYKYGALTDTIIIDGVESIKIYDVAGTLASITDPAGTITYNYRPDGQPKSIVAPGNVTTLFTYDEYGRQTSIVDPSAGTKSFTYDVAGNIIKETDAEGRITTMTYDPFNRLKTKNAGGVTFHYRYNADGLLASDSINTQIYQQFVYDEFFRLKTHKESVPDGNWLQKTYNYANGNVTSVAYASQSGDLTTQNFTYKNGHNTEIKLKDGTSIWQLTGENNLGMPTSSKTGELSRTYGYDEFGIPTLRKISKGSTALQHFTYEFNSQTGNLKWRKDNTRNIQEDFTYDVLNRLTGVGGKTISYDEKGNITYFPNVGTLKYEHKTKPYAITSIAPSKSGDMSNLNNYKREQIVTYNAMMRPASISENNRTTTFTYDGNANRVKMQTKAGNTTELTRYYIGGEYEVDKTVAGTEERLYLGGDAYSAAAVYVKQNGKGAINYIGRDYLGSITHVMDATGVVKQELSYDPWGRFRNPVTQALYDIDQRMNLILGSRGYTGHEHLDAYGLINMNARLYDPIIGRFLSPDPYVQAPDLSQNFNRYSYVMNNPLKYNDITGEWFGIDDLIVAGVGFVAGYVSHGLSTGNWGAGAVASGAMGAVGAWLGYNTAGLSTGVITNSTWNHIAGLGVNTIAGQFMPSYTIPLGNFGISVSPTIGLGSNGLTTGAGLGVGYSDGNISLSGSVGFGTSGFNAKSGYAGWNASAMYKGYGLGYGKTSYSKSEYNGHALGAQVVGTATAYFNYNSFAFSNDALGDGKDRWRTNAVELTLGRYSIGTHLFTNSGGDASGGETSDLAAPLLGKNSKKSWTNGQAYSSPLWIGYRKNNQITRIGFSHPMVQNLTQNLIHKYATPTPYFLDYDNFKTGGYVYSGSYNSFSLW